MIYGGSLALAEGYSLNEEADIFNETSGAGGMVIEAGTDENRPIPGDLVYHSKRTKRGRHGQL